MRASLGRRESLTRSKSAFLYGEKVAAAVVVAEFSVFSSQLTRFPFSTSRKAKGPSTRVKVPVQVRKW